MSYGILLARNCFGCKLGSMMKGECFVCVYGLDVLYSEQEFKFVRIYKIENILI